MAKASRVRYSGVACFADDTQLDRVQAMGSSSNLTTEDVKELGSLNIVEFVDDIPQVDINLEANEFGSNQTAALLSEQAYGCRVFAIANDTAITNNITIEDGSIITSAGHRVPFKGIASVSAGATGTNAVYAKLDPTLGTQYVVQPSASAAPVNSQLLAYVVTDGSKVTAINDQRPTSMSTLDVTDFELTRTDIFVPVKQSQIGAGSQANNTVNRTMYMENCYVNRYDMSYQVKGNATETFGLETDNKRWFLNGAPFMNVDHFIAPSGGATSMVLTNTPSQLNSGKYLLKLIKNGAELTEVASGASATQYTINAGTKTVTFGQALVQNDLVKARYVSATDDNQFLNQVPSTTKVGGVKDGQIEIYFRDGGTDSQILRCQSVRISLPLRREPLNELGSFRMYDRPLVIPVEYTVTVELKDSDLEFFARMAGKDPNTIKELSISDFLKDKSLVVKVFRYNNEYRDAIKTKFGAGSVHPALVPLKTVVCSSLMSTGENWDVRMDSDASQTFNFKAYNFQIIA